MYRYYRLKSLIKRKLSNFGSWLFLKCHEQTATEIMILMDAEKPRRCEHCKLDPIHYMKQKKKKYNRSLLSTNLGKKYRKKVWVKDTYAN